MRANETTIDGPLCRSRRFRVCSTLIAVAIAWCAALALCVVALDVRAADDDLPGRVGRLASVGGQVYLSPPDRTAEWDAVGINYPISSGDNLWVADDGHAEVDYGGGQFRIAGGTNLSVSRLDDRQLTLFVAQGRLIVRVRALEVGESARVDTPNAQLSLARPGLYRIDVSPDRQTTTLVVREGEAIAALAAVARQVLAAQTATIEGAEPSGADVRNGVAIDGFDAWSADRDRYYDRGRSSNYVSRQMVGGAELDAYGYWENTSMYGPVWYPSAVAEDWAPYRDGYWTTMGGWGPTWVDAAPWGYAPSHYGRWVWFGSRWGWCPGPFAARPVWAPALVGWYGGAGWALRGGSGPVYGWVPLGWGDAYHPWWNRCSYRCWAGYNRPYAVNVSVRPPAPPPRYSNHGVPGAMTAVDGATLFSRKPIPANRITVAPSYAAAAPVLGAIPAPAPAMRVIPGVRVGERGAPPPAASLIGPVRPGRAVTAPVSGGMAVTAPGGMAITAPGGTPPAVGRPRDEPRTAPRINVPAPVEGAPAAPAVIAPAGPAPAAPAMFATPPPRGGAQAAPSSGPVSRLPLPRERQAPPAAPIAVPVPNTVPPSAHPRGTAVPVAAPQVVVPQGGLHGGVPQGVPPQAPAPAASAPHEHGGARAQDAAKVPERGGAQPVVPAPR